MMRSADRAAIESLRAQPHPLGGAPPPGGCTLVPSATGYKWLCTMAPSSPRKFGYISAPVWRSRQHEPHLHHEPRLHMLLGLASPRNQEQILPSGLLRSGASSARRGGSQSARSRRDLKQGSVYGSAFKPRVPPIETTYEARVYRKFYKWPDRPSPHRPWTASGVQGEH